MSASGPSVLNVVETNPFRHLNHLSLKFISASDIYLKKYLAECLLGLKVTTYGQSSPT
ncbi:MAG: hypothetical protein MJE68_21155 [Proteobacteria bacterium]|nr:hypothetical protein [Pseudomonadota bacterium]